MEDTTQSHDDATQHDLLAEESQHLEQQFVYATQGQRFLNWLIDNLLLRYGLSYLTGMAIGVLLAFIAPDFLNKIALDQEVGNLSVDFWILLYLVSILNYIVYYTLCEKLFKGHTLGKLITGTRAIRQDGQELTFKDALLRSLSRCVPLEPFSGFATLTWHDSWTDTMVVKSR